MKSIIFYFTGTGNSYYIAEQLASLATGNETMKIDTILKAKDYDLKAYSKIGFVLPVYYIHLPKLCIDIISGMNFEHAETLFLVASYAGNCGFAFEDFREISSTRGKNIQEYKVKMPGNYILEYGAFSQRSQERLLQKAEKTIKNIDQQVRNNGKTPTMKINIISKYYKAYAQEKIKEISKRGEGFYADDRCIKCQKCIKNCPVHNITIKDDKLIWGSNCAQCMRCIQTCKQEAISHKMLTKPRKRYVNPNVQL